MATNKKVSVDNKDIENAQSTWDSFVKLTKYSTYFVVIVLLLMAATLVSWS